MATSEVALIALDIRKWDLEAHRLSLTAFCVAEDEEKSYMFEQSLTELPEMVEEFVGKLKKVANMVQKQNGEAAPVEMEIANDAFVRQKVLNYFKRITTELYGKKRKRRHTRTIFTVHMDLYNENQDISFLSPVMQFYVALNWARKYYEKDDFHKALDPLRKLVRIKPDFGLAYKWLARCYKKVRRYEEAMQNYEKYAEISNSVEAKLDLGQSYRKGRLFDKALPIYQEVLKREPENPEANIGLAQIYYAQNNSGFLEILDKLYAADPDWLRKWLKTEFNFRIYQAEKTLLSPTMAAKYLGYNQVFDLTQSAFKNEVPSHFNSGKAKMSFYKEELDSWALVMNRFNVDNEDVVLYPNAIDLSQVETEIPETRANAEKSAVGEDPSGTRPATNVEDIIKAILAKKRNGSAVVVDETPLAHATKKNSRPRNKNASAGRSKISEKLDEASAILNEALEGSGQAVRKNNRTAAAKPQAKRRGRPRKVENL